MPRPHAILPPKIKDDVGALVEQLENMGWQVVSSFYDVKHFGNWILDLERDGKAVKFVKDRGQLMVERRPREELQFHDLWRAFDDYGEFKESVLKSVRDTDPIGPKLLE
jgi:hypothetical protein